MIASPSETQWFIVRGFYDNEQLCDEPPDPDDVWAVGDRVRLKNSSVEGVVCSEYAYLSCVYIQWDNKAFPTPIEPKLLIRITRYIPPGLTWKAPESFSEYEEILSVQSAQEDEVNFQVGDTVAPNWASGKGRRGKIVGLLKNNRFQVDWADGTTGKVRGDQLLQVLSTQESNAETGDRLWEQPETVRRPEGASQETSTQDKTELVEKVYAQLADADVWTTVQEVYQDLNSEYTRSEIKSALEQLEEQGKARRSLIGRNKVVWQKNVPNQVFTVSSPESTINSDKFDSSEDESSNGRDSDLQELRSRIPLTQHKSEVLQSEVQMEVSNGTSGFAESDSSLRVGNDSEASSRTVESNSESNLQHFQESKLRVPNSGKQAGTKKSKSRNVSQQQLEGGNNHQGRIHNGEVLGTSESQETGGVCSTTYLGDGEIFGKIPGVVWTERPEQRGSSSHQSQQTGQSNREFAADESFGALQASQQREQVQMEQTSEAAGHRSCLSISDRGCTEDKSSQKCDFNSGEKENQGSGDLLGICLNSQSMTFVAGSAWDFPLQQPSSVDLNSSDCAKSMNTYGESSPSDTLVFKLQETSELEKTLENLKQELSAVHQVASHLASQAKEEEQKTNEISFPISLISSVIVDPITSASKMYEVSSAAHTNQEEPPEDFLNGFSGSFPNGGMVFNGKFSTQPSLALPSPESGSFWLRSPQALSSSSKDSRPPGQSKLEVQLRELGLIGQDQVINPEFLSRGLYNLPSNWASKSEQRAATEILEISVKPTEIVSIPALQPLPLVTSSELKQPEESLQQNEAVQSAQSTKESEVVQSAQSTKESEVVRSAQSTKENEAVRSAQSTKENEVVRSAQSTKENEAVQSAQSTKESEAVQSAQDEFVWLEPGQYWINPEWVKMDLGTQCRVKTDKDSVKYYASQMDSNLWEWEASPVGLLWDGEQLIPYDGHHRLEAAIAAGKKSILAQIEEGDLTRAIALSCGSNKKPSLRRTPEDNRKTIAMLEDLRKQHGDEWLLNIINAELPLDKQFKQLSLRAMEAYTGIPFRTIKDVKDKVKKELESEKASRIAFTPTPDEIQIIEVIMAAEGLEKPSDVFRWLLQIYQES